MLVVSTSVNGNTSASCRSCIITSTCEASIQFQTNSLSSSDVTSWTSCLSSCGPKKGKTKVRNWWVSLEGRIHQQKAVEQLQIFGAAAGFDDAHETEDLHPNPTPRLPLPHIQLQFWVHQLGGSCTSADIKKLWSLSELLYHKCVFWKPKKNCWNEHPSTDVINWREKWWQKSKRSCIFENLKIPQSLLIWNLKNQHLPKLHCDKMHF